MKFVLSTEQWRDELRYNHSEAELIVSGATVETKASMVHSFGKVSFREIGLDLANILMGEYQLSAPVVLKGVVEEPMVEMHFNFDSTIWLGESSLSKLSVGGMCHNVFGFNGVRGFVDFSEGHFFKTFDIHLSLDYVKKWFGESPMLDRFIDDFEHNRPAMLYPQAMHITPQMQDVIRQILNCPLSGFTRKIYLESKVQELFSLQVELSCFMSNIGGYVQRELSTADIAHIHEAKRYIEDNLKNPKSIEDLARICGTNQQKLKIGFKKLFGTTIFGYLQQYRMLHARDLLLEGLPVNEVSYFVGYANHSSFSHAFREYFGFSPIKIHQVDFQASGLLTV